MSHITREVITLSCRVIALSYISILSCSCSLKPYKIVLIWWGDCFLADINFIVTRYSCHWRCIRAMTLQAFSTINFVKYHLKTSIFFSIVNHNDTLFISLIIRLWSTTARRLIKSHCGQATLKVFGSSHVGLRLIQLHQCFYLVVIRWEIDL